MPVQTDKTQPTMRFDVGGMHCAACSSRIERVLGKMPGIDRASVNLASNTASVWASQDAPPDLSKDIMARVASLGFTAVPAKEDDAVARYERSKANAEKERRERAGRLWPMMLFCVPLLIVSMGHMIGVPLPAWLEPHANPRAFIIVQFMFTAPVIWLGRHFYTDGLGALFRRSPNMDSLVAVGTGAAFLYSVAMSIAAFAGRDPVQCAMNLYYESSAVLLAMIELGKYLEFSARRKAGDAIGALMSVAPETALRVEKAGAKPEEIPITEVRTGDLLLVRPGSRIPVDGVAAEGRSAVDLSLLTGESMPVPVGPGDELTAGSVNGEGSLIMKATAVGQDTRLARIVRLVRDAQGSKAPIARLADRVSYYFVPAVMLFGLLAGLAWLFFSQEPFTVSLTVFVSVLVMACPCAMGLATPMSIMVGSGRGAQLGVLIKNGAALERAAQITTLCLDKTGTLTTGKPELTGIYPQNEDLLRELNCDVADLLTLAASLEGRSEHPLGLAIIRAAEKEGHEFYNVDDVKVSPGLGIEGQINHRDALLRMFIGNEAFMAENHMEISGACARKLQELADGGQTPLIAALEGKEGVRFVCAVIALADQLRPEAAKEVEELRKMGLRLVMLTGDNDRTAGAIARTAGIGEVAARLLPAMKADYVRGLREKGEVVGMVGDGLNDAPALALADVGMAVGSGVDISAEAGDIVLMRGGMAGVRTALSLSRATMLNIKENLGWAFGYNILGLPIAAGALHLFGGPMLSPMIAGGAMAMSSVSVVSNALRLRWFGRGKKQY